MTPYNDQELDFSAYSRALRKRIPLIILLMVVFGITSFLFTWTRTPVWEARAAVILPVPEQDKNIALLVQPQTDSLGVLSGVLMSRTAITALADVAGEKVRSFQKAYSVEGDPATNQILISYRSEDKDRALEVVDQSIKQLEKIDRRVGFSRAGRQADEYEKALSEARGQEEKAQQKLLTFQKSAKTVATSDPFATAGRYLSEYQSEKAELFAVQHKIAILRKSVTLSEVPEIAAPTGSLRFKSLRDQLTSRELDLRMALSEYPETAPQVQSARKAVQDTRGQLQTELDRYIKSVNSSASDEARTLFAQEMLLKWQVDVTEKVAKVAPEEAMSFYRLIHEVTDATARVANLTTAYDTARLQSQVNKVRWSILDAPYLLDKAVNKNYTMNVGAAAFLGLAIGCIYAWMKAGAAQ